MGHRYYDTATGRFLTRDPIGAGRNWYDCCDNNPLKWTDPSGLDYVFISEDYGGAGNGGHARIGLWDGNPKHPIVWYGFYSDGIHENDAPKGSKQTVAKEISKDQRLKIRKAILQELSEEQRRGSAYRLRGNNCAEFMRDILFPILEPGSAEDGKDIQTPHQLVEWGKSIGGITSPPATWGGGSRFPWDSPRPPKGGGGSSSGGSSSGSSSGSCQGTGSGTTLES